MKSMLLFVSFFIATVAWSQPTAQDMLAVNTSLGTDFWIAIPANELLGFPANELEIYVASAYDTDIQLYDAGGAKTINRKVTKGNILTLSTRTGECNWTWEVREAEQPIRKGIRITSEKPISVYVLNSKQTSSDGYLALPTHVWGIDYINCSYFDFREFSPWAGGFLVVSKENGTILDIDLRGVGENDAKTSGGKKINTGTHIQVNLDEGEVYMVKGDAATRGIFDLTGSRIRSTRPVGFIPFHERTTMPNMLVNGNGRNNLCEMMPPVNAWGKKYFSVELKRENLNGTGKGDVFRVVASEPNTKWSLKWYDKSTKALLGNDGGTLAKAGDFADLRQSGTPTTLTNGYSVWSADKPVFVMQYSCSQTWDGDPILDPFMVSITPQSQFITSSLFQSPTATKFGKHRLNLIVWADSANPNYIDNLKSLAIDSIPVWSHPNAETPQLLFTRMPGSDNMHWCTIEFGPTGKSHTITSNGKVKFAGYLYGFGAADAYGWPIGAYYRDLTAVDTMPPKLTRSEACGDYDYEATELRNIPNPPTVPPHDGDQVETGISDIDFVQGVQSSNYRIVLITSQRFSRDPSIKTFKFRLEVIDRSKDAQAVIRVTDFGANTSTGDVNVTYDTIRYQAPKLRFTPSELSFGKHRTGELDTIPVWLTNDEDAPTAITSLGFRWGNAFRSASGQLPQNLTIQAHDSVQFLIEYDASRDSASAPAGKDIDTLVASSDCGAVYLPISGFAVEPKIRVDDFDFGSIPAGFNHCLPLRIYNPGSDELTVQSITGFEGSSFYLSNPLSPKLPIRIPAGKSVDVNSVCFQRPDVARERVSVTIASNAVSGDSVMMWIANETVAVNDEAYAGCTHSLASIDNDVLTVDVCPSVSQTHDFTIVDLKGAVVCTLRSIQNTGSSRISVANISSGAYRLLVRSEGRTESIPFVIAR